MIAVGVAKIAKVIAFGLGTLPDFESLKLRFKHSEAAGIRSWLNFLATESRTAGIIGASRLISSMQGKRTPMWRQDSLGALYSGQSAQACLRI